MERVFEFCIWGKVVSTGFVQDCVRVVAVLSQSFVFILLS